MDNRIHKSIISFIRKHRGLSKDCLVRLKENFPDINHDTLYSILSFEYQKRMRVNYIKSRTNLNKYFELYTRRVDNCERPGILLRMAEELDICPCLIAKMILQKYLEIHEIETIYLNNYLRDTTTIPDHKLAYEIFLCTLYDNLYSPLIDTMKHSLGQEYEIKLHNQVVQLGLAFRDEEHLRKYGYDKTPDVKLDVPIAIDGFIINWIESKALFGDVEVHKEYTKNQYLSYWNRFGSGLVIYWFGFPQSILQIDEKRFMIKDHLPENIVQIKTT